MNIKKALLLFVFLFFLNLVFASDLIFDDWVYHQSNITLDDKVFNFRISSQGNALQVSSGSDMIILNKDTCKKFDIKRQFCFNDTYYEEAGSTSNKAYVTIHYLVPKLNITRTIDNNILKVGEYATFESIIKNTGDISVRDVYFVDSFPDNILVKSAGTCQHTDHAVSWNGDISSDQSIVCSYKITTTGAVDVNTIAKASYNDGFQDRTNYSSAIRIYSSSIFTVNSTVLNKTIEIGQETELRINITNTGDDRARVLNFTVKIPSGLNVTYSSIRKETENLYSWSGDVFSNQSKDITIKFIGLKSKSSEIIMNAKYEYQDVIYEIPNIKNNVVIEDKGIELSSNLLSTEHIDSGQEKNIFFSVKNLNNYTDLKNVVLKVKSDLFPGGEYILSNLEKSSYKKIMDITLKIPDVNTTGAYTLKANVTYETLYGDSSSDAFQSTIYVEPVKKLIIGKTISPSSVEEKKEATVTVKIKNDRNTDVENVEVKEILSSGILQRGTTSTTIPLIKKGETKTAYTYTIISPDVINETIYTINTTAKYKQNEQEYLFFSSSSMTVIPKKLKIKITKRVADTDIYKGEIVNVLYTLKNEEAESAKNLVLLFAENEKYDAINVFNYSLASLNPGEEVTVEKEQVRPKEASDKLVLDGSKLYYEDMKGAKFNATSDSLSLKVKDTYMQGPAILLQKTLDAYSVNRSDEVTVLIQLKNIGDESVNLIIRDGDRNWNETVKANSEIALSYKTRFYNPGEFILPKVYAFYDYLGNRYKVSSNVIKINVIDPTIPVSEKKDRETGNTGSSEEIVPEKTTQKKKNFFADFWDTFIGLFSFLKFR